MELLVKAALEREPKTGFRVSATAQLTNEDRVRNTTEEHIIDSGKNSQVFSRHHVSVFITLEGYNRSSLIVDMSAGDLKPDSQFAFLPN